MALEPDGAEPGIVDRFVYTPGMDAALPKPTRDLAQNALWDVDAVVGDDHRRLEAIEHALRDDGGHERTGRITSCRGEDKFVWVNARHIVSFTDDAE